MAELTRLSWSPMLMTGAALANYLAAERAAARWAQALAAERVMCLDAGRIIAIGSPSEVMGNPRVQEAYLGT